MAGEPKVGFWGAGVGGAMVRKNTPPIVNNNLVKEVVASEGAELTGLRKFMFDVGKTRVGSAIFLNPKKSIAAGVLALGALTMWLRSGKKELPPQADLTPIAAPMQFDNPAAADLPADYWQKQTAARNTGVPAR